MTLPKYFFIWPNIRLNNSIVFWADTDLWYDMMKIALRPDRWRLFKWVLFSYPEDPGHEIVLISYQAVLTRDQAIFYKSNMSSTFEFCYMSKLLNTSEIINTINSQIHIKPQALDKTFVTNSSVINSFCYKFCDQVKISVDRWRLGLD